MNEDEDYYDNGEPEDAEEDLENCGSRRHGQCDLAGTEWCDWSCPLHDIVFRAAIKRAIKKDARR